MVYHVIRVHVSGQGRGKENWRYATGFFSGNFGVSEKFTPDCLIPEHKFEQAKRILEMKDFKYVTTKYVLNKPTWK